MVAILPSRRRALEIAFTLVRHYEGFRPEVYEDPAGYATIGYGTRWTVGMPQRMSEAEAAFHAIMDLAQIATALEGIVDGPDGRMAALYDFCYNLGVYAFLRGSVYHAMAKGDLQMAARSMEAYVYAGGRKLKGLQRRRHAERLLFTGEVKDPQKAIQMAEEMYP